jgi:hypothetical protein
VELPTDPDELRKMELEQDPDFARFIRLLKVKIPLLSIRQSIEGEGVYHVDDILLFASKSAISQLVKTGTVIPDKYK